MGRPRKQEEVDVVDPTGWMIANDVADFLLVNKTEVLYMCMLGYTFMHGSNVFSTLPKQSPFAFKLINMIMACTGGGILVPIFINAIPVPLANDAYPIAILVSFGIHYYFPIIGEVMKLSAIFKACVIVLYETLRAKVVVALTVAAANAIPASTFAFPVFGPIMCGTIAGCGGAFLPLNKGLDPISKGMKPPMITALLAATCLHLFLNTVLSDGVVAAKQKAHLHIALMFISTGLVTKFDLHAKVKND